MPDSPCCKLLCCLLSFGFCVYLAGCTASDADRKSLETGFTQYSARQFDQAQAAADGYIQKNPNDPNVGEAYYLRGLARLSKGAAAEKPAALQDFQTAIAKSNRVDLKAKANRALGDMAFDATHWQEAVDDYEKSLDAVPGDHAGGADVHVNYRIGAGLQNLGQWERAKPYFQRVAALNGDPVLAQRAISRMDAKNFSLQFGAFREGQKAADLVKQLKSPPAGTPPITATITTELRDNQLLYLVRSGSYPTWEEADAARARALAKHPLVSVVP